MANDTQEEFWGCTLTKDKKEYIWDPSADSEEDVEHKLQLTSACLGHKAKDGERNLLELTTEDTDGKKITCPFVSLRVGGKECIHLDLGFCNKTKFTLKEGSGPIALCGVHLKALPLDFDENADSSEDEEVPDLIPAEPIKKETKKPEPKKVEEKKEAASGKRPITDNKKNESPAKKAKVVQEEEDDEDNDESDDEELSENEDTPSLLDAEAEEGSEDDSEEGDDEPEGDDVDSDEDEEMDSEDDDGEDESEDEDEEEEEDEKEEVKKPSKAKVNGHTPKATPGKGGPQKNKTPAAEVKTPNTKKTPGKKDTTTTPKSQAKKTPEELKAFLLKSPNLPKKFDKFANFMKNNMKVTDEKSQKEFWDYLQKNKK